MNEFLKFISDKKIWIYGAGYVAFQFWKALKKHGLEVRIQGVVVTQIVEPKDKVGDFFVKPISQLVIDKESVVCIAVHEVYKDEIESILCKKGIANYIWVYPFLYELHLGMPVLEGKWVDVRKFIPMYDNQYGVAIRWAAIEDYYGICHNGFCLYKKAMAVHSNRDTAEARAKRFKELIYNWDVFGYQDEMQIIINRMFDVLDGEHRVALALYHRQNKLKCRIYDGKNIHCEKTRMTKKMLYEGGFTQEEMEQLDEINIYIKNIIL